jgi:hypothetical protein
LGLRCGNCKHKKSKKSKTERGRGHSFLRSRTRGSLKVGLAMHGMVQAANFAGLLAWR